MFWNLISHVKIVWRRSPWRRSSLFLVFTFNSVQKKGLKIKRKLWDRFELEIWLLLMIRSRLDIKEIVLINWILSLLCKPKYLSCEIQKINCLERKFKYKEKGNNKQNTHQSKRPFSSVWTEEWGDGVNGWRLLLS